VLISLCSPGTYFEPILENLFWNLFWENNLRNPPVALEILYKRGLILWPPKLAEIIHEARDLRVQVLKVRNNGFLGTASKTNFISNPR